MEEYRKLTVTVSPEDAEMAVELLAELGIVQVIIEDRRDVEKLEFPPNHWARIDEKLLESMPEDVRITAYLPDTEESESLLGTVEERFARAYPTASIAVMREDVSGWESSWKDLHGTVYAGERFAIYPPWEERPAAVDFAIEIDPGMAFGTGGHATTTLCLELIEAIAPRGKEIADIGTGSGILAIACALLGNPVIGVDIDADCVKEARRNAAANGLEIEFREGDLLEGLEKSMDVLIANIIDDAVLAMLPIAKERLKRGGWFIGSGIEESRWPEVAEMLEKCGYGSVDMRQREGWCAFRAVLL